MDSLTRLLMQGAAGGAAAGLGIEEVFSTYITVGAGGQTITNGMDLATEGGMVWSKARDVGVSFAIHDTERGTNKFLSSDSTAAQIDVSGTPSFHSITSFNTDGFTTGNDGGYGYTDLSGYGSYVHWTFRKAPGFFDVVTYTGNGTTQSISHSLGSTPGWVLVKRTDSTGEWTHLHRNDGVTWKQVAGFNTSALVNANGTVWGSDPSTFVAPTSSSFTVGQYAGVNASGGTYVAYVFAHDEQIFGESADQSVINCGSYTGNGSASGPTVNLGWEPQFLIVKCSTSAFSWNTVDSMRGMPTGANSARLQPNSFVTENSTVFGIDLTPTGFQVASSNANVNSSGETYIYIAIRRGPMKTPEDATTVLKANTRTGTGADTSVTGIGFSPDLVVTKTRTSSVQDNPAYWYDRLRGNYRNIKSNNAQSESGATGYALSGTTQETADILHVNNINRAGDTAVDWFFRRAPGFFDVVAYTGDATAGRTVNHNLGVTPELMIVKSRSNFSDWIVYSSTIGTQPILKLNTTIAATDFGAPGPWNNTTPTSSVFSVSGTGWDTNNSGITYVAYLFATVSGVSKVGSYTGTAATLNIDCGFSAGARFVLIKRTDSTGDWYVWDTARGITAGNDPYLLLNSSAAEVTGTDYIDPLSSGFQISSTAPADINASGGSFIFLAVA